MIQNVQLSKREKEVAKLVLKAKSNKQIALSLDISVRTVEFYLNNIYAKFQVSSRIELILNLGIFTGDALTEKLGYSTVDKPGENTENRGRLYSRMDWMASFRNTVSRIGKELRMKNILKNPSAFIPLGMSFAALATVLVHIALFGATREADEGTAAHIWQTLMAAQTPIILLFAIKWLPRTPRQALLVLALQAGAAFAALAPVFVLNL
jgi:DNA-binding CsgD family transcriptional regulator